MTHGFDSREELVTSARDFQLVFVESLVRNLAQSGFRNWKFA
jgi:hypothetical protein